MGLIAEDVVRSSAHDDTAFFRGDISIQLVLLGLNAVVWRWLIHFHSGEHGAGNEIRSFLFIILHIVCVKTGFLHGHIYKFVIVERNTQFRRQSAANFVSAASELATDGYDDFILCHSDDLLSFS